MSDSVSPYYLPVIIFIVCGLTSFSTGTSWGTMAIIFPIAIPLAASVSKLGGLSPADSTLILHGVISSVLTGMRCEEVIVSPISDTTVLSSIASGCDHVEHVRTQLPYAIILTIVTILIGDIRRLFWTISLYFNNNNLFTACRCGFLFSERKLFRSTMLIKIKKILLRKSFIFFKMSD